MSVGRSQVVGIDIGGTRTKFGVVGASGEILSYDSLTTGTHGDPGPFLSELATRVARLVSDGAGGIGLSLPGILADDLRSIAFNPNTPSVEQFDFGRWLDQFGVPYTIEQDLNAAAFGEYVFGVGSESDRFLVASIGTGLGAAMLIDGVLLRFSGGTLGDSGHVILDPTGPRCASGCAGCAEAYVCVAALRRVAADVLPVDESIDGPERDDLPAALIAAARTGDPRSIAAIEAVGNRLGQWLASIAPIFLPDRVALCGGVAEAGTALLRACRESFAEIAGDPYKNCEVLLGEFGGRAGVVGAAAPLLLGNQ